jgi:hypothetical protein
MKKKDRVCRLQEYVHLLLSFFFLGIFFFFFLQQLAARAVKCCPARKATLPPKRRVFFVCTPSLPHPPWFALGLISETISLFQRSWRVA